MLVHRYILLSVILAWHFKYLFPIYLDKVYSAAKDIGELVCRGSEFITRSRLQASCISAPWPSCSQATRSSG